MSKIIHRGAAQPKFASAGDGAYLIDESGKRYLDGCCGAAVSCLGHSEKRVINAVKKQLDELAYAHTGYFTTHAAEDLADFLIANSPAELQHVYFLNGGSEAVETALKLARQYKVEIGQPQRTKVVARLQSYHGNTLTSLAVGGNLARRTIYEPLLLDVSHANPCYPYRGKLHGESDDEYVARLISELSDLFESLGPNQVLAFVAETVVGATLGAQPALDGYFKGVRELCDRHGILLILDEIMSGMGRTGELFAYSQEHIKADLVTIAKGLAGGYQPLSAVLATADIYQAIAQGSGQFQHGHTYICHPSCAAAGLAVQQIIQQDDLLANVKNRGTELKQALNEVFKENPYIGDIRGRGLFLGVELVADREHKTPFKRHTGLDQKIKQHAMANGLMVYPGNGTADGTDGHHILLAPPFIINNDQVGEIASLLHTSVNQALKECV